MTADDIRATILDAIDTVAPGSLMGDLDADADLRDALDLDSMDILNVMTALQERLQVEIPEVDQPHVMTLNRAVAYLARKLRVGSG